MVSGDDSGRWGGGGEWGDSGRWGGGGEWGDSGRWGGGLGRGMGLKVADEGLVERNIPCELIGNCRSSFEKPMVAMMTWIWSMHDTPGNNGRRNTSSKNVHAAAHTSDSTQ